MRKQTCIALSLAMAAQLLLSSCGILPQEEEFQTAPVVAEYEGAKYGKTAVEKGDMIETEEISMKYQGTDTYSVKLTDAREVKKVYVKKGSKVSEGDLLIRFTFAEQEKKIAENTFKIAQNNLKIKQERALMAAEIEKQKKIDNDAKQIKSIREQHAATISSYQTEIKIMNIEVKQAKNDITEEDIHSKVSGRVTFLKKALTGTKPKDDVEILKVEGKKRNCFKASTGYADHYKPGDSVSISVGNKTIKGTVGEETDKDYKLVIYPKSTKELKSGDSGSIQCVLKERKNVLYLPSATVYEMGDKRIVYVENDKGLKTMKEVQVGVEINHLTEIKSGLKEGEQVITD